MAKAEDFEIVITADQQWPAEQNLPARHIGVIVLTNANWLLIRRDLIVRRELILAVERIKFDQVLTI